MIKLRPDPDTFQNEVCIEDKPMPAVRCKKCNKDIKATEVRVIFKRFYSRSLFLHLACYTPVTTVRIDKKDKGIAVKNKKIREKVDEWIDNWNRQFGVNEEAVRQFENKRVRSYPSGLYIAILQACSYLRPREIVRTITFVSKAWYHVAWEDELWRRLGPGVLPEGVSPSANYRNHYMRCSFSTCSNCKRYLKDEERHMLCPLTFKPKCLPCYSDPLNRPQRIRWVRKTYGMTMLLLRKLNVPIFNFNGFDCIYLSEAIEKVNKHRKRIANQIIAKETQELDEVFTNEMFSALSRASEQDFSDEKTFSGLLEKGVMSVAQKQLFYFIAIGRSMTKFEKFVSQVKAGVTFDPEKEDNSP
jgi:hypothetical protein